MAFSPAIELAMTLRVTADDLRNGMLNRLTTHVWQEGTGQHRHMAHGYIGAERSIVSGIMHGQPID